MNTDDLINILLNPDTYPHPVEVITTIETHISIVFLTGQYAYKLKKSVDFGFLDFSTRQQRETYCFLEVKLNKRTAPELYIGVNKLTLINGKYSLTNHPHPNHIEDQTQPIEYLVKMRQFDPNQVLGRRLKQGVLNYEMLQQLTEQIVHFHKHAEVVNLSSEFGDPEVQRQPMLDNFPTLKAYFLDEETKQPLSELEEWTHNQYKLLTECLMNRKATGFVRACHGDLHLDNITLIDDKPVLFDGIEFNEYFRWIDVISDLAFLLIDLDFKHQHACGYKLLSLYLSQTLDFKGLKLLNFYRVYRTLVRAKITALRALQLPSNSTEKSQVETTSQQYIHQAYRYSQKPKQPKCILLQGVSGSGKSYLANQLLDEIENFEAIIISSDRIRKSVFGIAPFERVSEEDKKSLYSTQMNQKTYQAMAEYTATCLQQGFNVIVDATFLKYEHRSTFYKIAENHQAVSSLISISSDNETLSNAIQTRQKNNNNPSDADILVMQNQKKYMEPPQPHENALALSGESLRQFFPKELIQDFINQPIK